MKLCSGTSEQGIVVGNTYDKYGSRNPLVRRIMAGFVSDLQDLVDLTEPSSIHEVGCGEGYWTLLWKAQGRSVCGSDFSRAAIELARKNALEQGLGGELFRQRSIYDLNPAEDSADLVVCCEVLEHLESPEMALRVLRKIARRRAIFSVPREPIWRMLNMARGQYWSQLGNTPGHLQHWSRGSFTALVSRYFKIDETRSPLPWTMLLCSPLAE